MSKLKKMTVFIFALKNLPLPWAVLIATFMMVLCLLFCIPKYQLAINNGVVAIINVRTGNIVYYDIGAHVVKE